MLAYPAIPSIYPYYGVEQQFVKWDFVIKVKHGDTLRRLGGHVDGKHMDYTINKLRNKIISLFKFIDDADLILTYTDIDGDIVTLDNDDELRDAVIGQRLNPIRISVHLKSKPDTSLSAASLPSKTSSVAPVQNSISDIQKPVFADMVELEDMAQPFLNSPADLSKSNQTVPISGSTSTKLSVVSANPMNHNIASESIWSPFRSPSTNEKLYSVTKQNDSSSTLTDGYAFGFPKPTPLVSTNSSYTPAEGGSKSTTNEAPKVSFEQINQRPPQHSDLRGFHMNDLGKPNTIHRDVQRDIWGLYPIVGPSFLSIPKEAHVQGTEYAKHWPTLSAPTQFLHGCRNEFKQGLQQRSNLDSVFVKDMTVLDGTVMPPSAPFIKTWKMRNSGTANWPCGTQLVWVGGHQLGHIPSFTLEQIPARGLPVGAEFDVSVGFTAPSLPGCYVSYWRLQCPNVHKFGQRVSMDFEVRDISCFSFSNFNLNLPPKTNTQSTGKENAGIDINADPVSEVGSTEATKKNTSNNELADITGDNEGFVKYDSVDPTLVADCFANVNDNCKVRYENSVEDDCLNELEDMGFKQVELNREVLRRNKYDLDLTIENLCGFSQWDSLLFELHNMDFCDRELNKRMLVKNGGSFKRTVLDLSAENKD